jgi:hypothetical protein
MTIIYTFNVKLTHDGVLAYFINPTANNTVRYSARRNSIFAVQAVNAITTVDNAGCTLRHNVI